MESNKLIIICLTVILCCLIVAGTVFLVSGSGINLFSQEEKILATGDLKLNLTGYNYKLVSNQSTGSGFTETYNVNGQGDSFTLTITVSSDNPSSTSAVASTQYLNGKNYLIQMSGGNQEHNTQGYLESLIITKGSQNQGTTSDSGTSSSSSSSKSVSKDTSSSSSSSSSSSGVKTRYCTTHGRVVTDGSNTCPLCVQEGLDSRTVKGSTEYV